jgi:predicted ATPase
MTIRTSKARNATVLRQLSIKNFKAFSKLQSIPIRPITLIFGANSSGKSSILHSLLFLSQIQIEPSSPHANITFTELGGNVVDLGGFPNVTYKHSTSNTLQFTIDTKIHQFATSFHFSIDVFFNKNGDVDKVTYNVNKNRLISLINLSERGEGTYTIRGNEISTRTKVVFHNIQQLCDETNSSFSDEIVRVFNELAKLHKTKSAEVQIQTTLPIISTQNMREFIANTKISTDIQSSFLADRILSDSAIPLLRIKQRSINHKFFMNEDELFTNIQRAARQNNETLILNEQTKDSVYTILAIIAELCIDHSETIFNQIQRALYLGPLRKIPSRNFNEMFEPNQEKATGLLAWKRLSGSKEITNNVNIWMKKLGIKYRIISEQIYERNQLDKLFQKRSRTAGITAQDIDSLTPKDSHLRFEDLTSKTNVSHRDLGIGVTQVLPIIVNALSLTNSLILIEQPELHLHPKLQAELAELFIETAVQKNKQNNTYILETHSEHIILRILRKIREGDLSPNDVSILYISPDRTGSTINHIGVDKDGDFLDHWPDGFFEESYRERMAGR